MPILRIIVFVGALLLALQDASAYNYESQPDLPVLGNVYELTDLNFDLVVNNTQPWMVDVFAPWCPACRDLEPLWRLVAVELATDGIFVGKIDSTKQKALTNRFAIRHFPSIYHLYEGETREYTGKRTVREMVKFAQSKWRTAEARTGCGSPVSRCGRALGVLSKLPALFKHKYMELRDRRKYSDVSLFAGMLAVPVVFGLAVIALLDFYNSRRPLGGPNPRHVHQD